MWGDIVNAKGEKLDYCYTGGSTPNAELVVIGHGVTGNKDRPWALTLAQALCEAGYATLRFSFSGNGESQGDFGDSCPTKESADLSSLLDLVLRDVAEGAQVTYVGHSMGAAVGVLRASQDSRITRLVSLGGMVDTLAFAKRKFEGLRPDHDLMWELPGCVYSQVFHDDMSSIHSVAPLATKVSIPWLLIHGTEDSVVPFAESESLALLPGGPKLLRLIDGCDHVFTGDFAGKMAEEVCAWLRSSS